MGGRRNVAGKTTKTKAVRTTVATRNKKNPKGGGATQSVRKTKAVSALRLKKRPTGVVAAPRQKVRMCSDCNGPITFESALWKNSLACIMNAARREEMLIGT